MYNNGIKNIMAALKAPFIGKYGLTPSVNRVDHAFDNNFQFQSDNAAGTAALNTFKPANASNLFEIANGLVLPQLATPAAPVITTAGTAGVVTWTYLIVARGAGGASPASATGSTTTGNATLTSANYNIITFSPVSNATSYDIYRTVAGTTPSTIGLIGNVPATQAGQAGTYAFNDTALAGDASVAQTVNTSGALSVGVLIEATPTSTIATAGAVTYTAAQVIGGIISRDTAAAPRSDVTPTAAQIVAAIPNVQVGSSFAFYLRNNSGAANAVTLTAGTNVTLTGTMTVAQSAVRCFIGVVTNVGAPAVTLFSMGSQAF